MSAIGVFDSGLGGLTTVLELQKILPNEEIIYFGDTGRVPYGTKSKNTIIKYAKQDISFLKFLDVKMIIAACGTVSSVAAEHLNVTLPFVDVVNPTSIVAANATSNGKIGIIGTTATIKSKAYFKKLKRINPKFKIYQKDCPMLVPMVENGLISKNDPVVIEIIKRYLENFNEIDTLILGCTHYPILKNAISYVMNKNVKLIDSGKETAIFAADMLKKKKILNSKKNTGKTYFYVSDEIENFKENAKKFLNFKDCSIKKINIEEF